MSNPVPTGTTPRPDALPTETVRAIAVILLVSFHVIGGVEAGKGLGLDYPHPLRFYADMLVDLRMPLFAFIAGAVWGFRPVRPDQLGGFLAGKLRRLALPGLTAITVFLLMATLMGTSEGIISHPWDAYLRNYAIFWFLQAMLVIFVIYGTLDILTDGRVLLPCLILAFVAVVAEWRIPTNVMSLNRVTHLLAYFLLGLAFVRHLDWVRRQKTAIIGLALVALVAGLAMNLAILSQTGQFSTQRLDLQSLLFGGGACLAAFLLLPRLGWLQWLGAFSLTIYLYHILATSMSRRLLLAMGIESPWLLLLAGTVLGIAFPVALHLICQRYGPTRLMVLGLRDKSARRTTMAAAPA